MKVHFTFFFLRLKESWVVGKLSSFSGQKQDAGRDQGKTELTFYILQILYKVVKMFAPLNISSTFPFFGQSVLILSPVFEWATQNVNMSGLCVTFT